MSNLFLHNLTPCSLILTGFTPTAAASTGYVLFMTANPNLLLDNVIDQGDQKIINEVTNLRDILKNVEQRFRARTVPRPSRFEIGGHKGIFNIGCCNDS